MSNARRNQNLPRPHDSDIERVPLAEGSRFRPQIHQHYLKHAVDWNPEIGLFEMIVERLDRPRIAERRRHLRRSSGEIRSHALADPNDFGEVSTVVGPDGKRVDPDTFNEVRRVGFENYLANALGLVRGQSPGDGIVFNC